MELALAELLIILCFRIFGRKPEFDDDCTIEYDPNNSVLPEPVEIGFTKENYATLTEDFRIPENNLNWIAFGRLILKVYHYLEDNNYSLCSWYTWDDWVGKAPEFQSPRPVDNEAPKDEQINGIETVDDSAPKDESEPADDSGTGKSPEVGEEGETPNGDLENQEMESKKSSNRRRCSDLDFLKEWGWHKNRRSARKKQKEEEDSVDASINGFIRRILPNYFVETFDSHHSPFAPTMVEVPLDESLNLDHSKADAEDEEKFYELTKDSFEKFKLTFRNREFDLVIPMFEWLRFVSLTWNQTIIPSEILLLFKKIYKIYEDFVDYHSMYHLPPDDFTSTFRMAMLNFELVFDDLEDTKAEIPDEFMRKKDFLQFNIGFIEDDLECTRMLTRLIWLSHCMQMHNNNYKDALGYLYKLEEVYDVPKYSEISVELKNNRHNKMIDCKTIKELIIKIERKINLASVQKLYETQNYEELTEILRESIIYSTEPKVNVDHLSLKIQTQIEVFLFCLWSLDRIPECLEYAEKSLKYATDNFLVAPTEYRVEEWASLVNFCLIYIDAAIKDEEGSEILFTLGNNLSRLVQTLTQIITHQLDTPAEKNNPRSHPINVTTSWTILYHLVLKESDIASVITRKKAAEESLEEEFEPVPNSLAMFFTAHEFMGRKSWCMKDNGKMLIYLLDVLAPIYRTPMLDPFREAIVENLEQTTYCLYGYPIKKAKLRHIEEHDAKNIDLTWERAIQLFDLYRPDTLPEFDSFKLSSISSEMEQLLQKILPLIPNCLDISPFTCEIKKFINGTSSTLPKEINILPPKIASIYYLLADFYFKNQETGKAIKFYISDLTMKPDRFDSWASLSLCKQSKLEMKLNAYASIGVKEFLEIADQTINCFNQCLRLKKTITILTEFASFSYHLHSFCSRNLKQSSETLSMENFSAIEERKDKFLNISFKSFSEVGEAINDNLNEVNSKGNQEESEENHEEKWYYHFMLGKIAEKRKEPPLNYLDHYLKSAKHLYEDNATYPIKINHGNPTHLAIESLEVFYRISACIMKYLEMHSNINKPTAKLFLRVLKEMSSSPFAFNRAKINKGNINAMKHKLNSSAADGAPAAKQPKIIVEDPVEKKTETISSPVTDPVVEKMEVETDAVCTKTEVNLKVENEILPPAVEAEPPIQPVIRNIIAESKVSSRRGSQESAVTTTTTTSTRSSTSSSDSSADSSSDSESSSSDEAMADKENVFVSQEVINNIYKMCIKNLEECVSRFPEHYKSIYRLVHHFLTVGDSIDKCKQLLLTSSYKTTLGNSINGLFSERKNNNFFNGIWRVPSQEIDRPGNFTTHLSKCVVILMEVLKKCNDYETLMDLALQLQRNPDADKKYLNDTDKKELFHQAVTCIVQAFKNKLREIATSNGDDKNRELLTLMLDIFKSHRKTLKIFQQKDQSLFSGVLVEVYKEYTKDKMTLPESANLTDLAFKMCQQEINYRKNLEKGIVTANPNPPSQFQAPAPAQLPPASTATPPILNIKSVSEINKTIMGSAGQSSSSKSSNNQAPPAQSSSKTAPASSAQTSGSSARTKPRSSGSSKNQSQSSLLNNPAAMNALMMQLYANPSLLTQLAASPESQSNYMNEYYKSLLKGTGSAASSSSSANASMLSSLTTQQLAMMNDPMTAMLNSLYSPLTQTPTTSTSTTKSSSSYEKKYLETLKNFAFGGNSSAKSMTGLQQNLMSNSLSITTTAMGSSSSSASSSKATTSKPQSSRKSTGLLKEPTSSISITKIADNGNKYKQMFASNLKLPDLPKSLSITPSLPGSSSKLNRVSDKGKSKERSSSLNRSVPSLSITPESAHPSKQNMQASFYDFLKNYSPVQAPLQVTKRSAPVNVSASASLLKPAKHIRSPLTGPSQPKKGHTQTSQPSTSTKAAQLPYDFGKNIASSFSGIPLSSPTMSKSPFSHSTPPLSHSPSTNISPTKTLQQKLAERKQQNQQQKKKPGESSPESCCQHFNSTICYR